MHFAVSLNNKSPNNDRSKCGCSHGMPPQLSLGGKIFPSLSGCTRFYQHRFLLFSVFQRPTFVDTTIIYRPTWRFVMTCRSTPTCQPGGTTQPMGSLPSSTTRRRVLAPLWRALCCSWDRRFKNHLPGISLNRGVLIGLGEIQCHVTESRFESRLFYDP